MHALDDRLGAQRQVASLRHTPLAVAVNTGELTSPVGLTATDVVSATRGVRATSTGAAKNSVRATSDGVTMATFFSHVL